MILSPNNVDYITFEIRPNVSVLRLVHTCNHKVKFINISKEIRKIMLQ